MKFKGKNELYGFCESSMFFFLLSNSLILKIYYFKFLNRIVLLTIKSTKVNSMKRDIFEANSDNLLLEKTNRPEAPPQKKTFRRSYKACINCRAKKIKCDLGDLANPSEPPCARCRREGRQCEFSVSRRGGTGNIKAGKQKQNAKEDTRSSSAEPLGAKRAEFKESNTEASSSLNKTTENEDNAIAGQELHTTSDALDLLANAARIYPKIESRSPSPTDLPPPTDPEMQETFQQHHSLAETGVIQRNYLTQQEAVLFIKL